MEQKGADPRPEDGHVDIANELVEQLCRVNLTARESRVLWFIFRKVNGWHKERDRISYSQFEKGTRLKHCHVARTLKKLQARNMITSTPKGNSIEYSVQNDYTQWQSVPHVGTEKNGTLLEPSRYPQGVTKTVPMGVHTKEKKETNKRKEDDYISLEACGDGGDEDGVATEITLKGGEVFSAKELWTSALFVLRNHVTPQSYERWLRDTEGLAFLNGALYISLPRPGMEIGVEKLKPTIKEALEELTGMSLEVEASY